MRNIIVGISLIASLCGLRAQAPKEFILHPQPMEQWSARGLVGVGVTFVPRPIAEEEIRQIPAIDARVRVGLPLGLSLGAAVNSNYITTLASGSVMWSVDAWGLAIGVSDRHSLWYGIATLDGFDVDATGWLNAPSVLVGTSFGEVHLSGSLELLYLMSRETRAGDVQVGGEGNRLLGGALGITLEQPFIKRSHLVLSLKLNSVTSAYQSWLAFSTFGDRLMYPEFMVGVIL